MTNLLDLDPPAHIRIHDTALAAIIRDLASVPPERGAALFGKNPVVTLTVPDTAGRYSPVSWDISAELSRTVQELEGAGLGEFMGTVHSHPAGLPVPSGGDLQSTMNLLSHNPKLNSVIVAIVTEGIPDQFNHVPVGRRHRMSIQLVGRQNGRAVVVPVPGVVVPISEVITSVGGDPSAGRVSVHEWLQAPDLHAGRLARFVDNQAMSGFVSEISKGRNGDTRYISVPLNYPVSGPLIVSENAGGTKRLLSLPWDPTVAPAQQIRGGDSSPFAKRAGGEVKEDPISVPDVETTLDRVLSLVGDLRNQHVLVAGLGSVGSRITEDLVRSGIGEVTLIDPELVAAPNIARSVYRFWDIGRPKTEALADILKQINPTVRINPLRGEIMDFNVDSLTLDVDLVVGATDDMAQQFVLSASAYSASVPMVACALYRGAKAGEVVFAIPELATPCISCCLGSATNTAGLKPDSDYGLGGRLQKEPGLGASIHAVASMASLFAFGLLGGPESSAAAPIVHALERNQSIGFISTVPDWEFVAKYSQGSSNQNAPQSVWSTVERSAECAVCSNPVVDDLTTGMSQTEASVSLEQASKSVSPARTGGSGAIVETVVAK